jgi:hypothetical protein
LCLRQGWWRPISSDYRVVKNEFRIIRFSDSPLKDWKLTLEASTVRFALLCRCNPYEEFFGWIEVFYNEFYLRDILCTKESPCRYLIFIHIKNKGGCGGVRMVDIAIDVSFAIRGLVVIQEGCPSGEDEKTNDKKHAYEDETFFAGFWF